MLTLKPSRRWQPAFYPFHKEPFGRRMLAKTELLIKGPLFGCRMCGNCVLQKTALICPMECPKGMRNGPCGGITPEGKCYVDKTRNCIWYFIYKKAEQTGRTETLLEVLPPLDWSKTGTETWGDVIKQVEKTGTIKFLKSLFSGNREKKNKLWEDVFRGVRQPEWWKGDREYHAPKYGEPVSELERKLRNGEFVFTGEIAPPLDTGSQKLIRGIKELKGQVTAINFTDSSSACPRMSGIACCMTALDNDSEPVLQIASRDTNRTRLQSDATGLNSLGIYNVLCITGDSACTGPSPLSNMNIHDLDSVQMLWILRKMRDEGKYLDGREMKNPPRFFLGAGSTPFAIDPKLQAIRDQKKVNAGAQFIQTNLVFEPDRLDAWLEELDKRNVTDKVFILAGVVPMKSFKVAEWLNTRVPGVHVPEKILGRMKKAGDNASEEGILIALELIQQLRSKKGINGIHIVTLGSESAVKRLVK